MEAVKELLSGLTTGKRDEKSDERLAELMLYIADISQADPAFGATKLNKLLYYSDFIAFRNFGESITGAEYMRLNWGPVPRRLIPVRDGLIDEEEAVLRESDYGSYSQDRLVPLRKAQVDLFKSSEIKLVDRVVEYFQTATATAISEFSHDRAWRIAEEDRGEIPYEAAFISDEPVTNEDRQVFAAWEAAQGAAS